MAISIHLVTLTHSTSARRCAPFTRCKGKRRVMLRRGVAAVAGLPAPARFPPRGIGPASFRGSNASLAQAKLEPHVF
jgi:hypothetical protein